MKINEKKLISYSKREKKRREQKEKQASKRNKDAN